MDVVHGKEMDVGMAGWEVVGNKRKQRKVSVVKYDGAVKSYI